MGTSLNGHGFAPQTNQPDRPGSSPESHVRVTIFAAPNSGSSVRGTPSSPPLSPKSAGPVPEPTEQSKTTQHPQRNDLHRNDLHRNDLHRNERTSMSTLPPIRREVLVDADPATAFDVFTVGIGRWWPLRELSV